MPETEGKNRDLNKNGLGENRLTRPHVFVLENGGCE